MFLQMLIRVESEEEAGEQLIQDIFGASDEEEEFVVRMNKHLTVYLVCFASLSS